MNDKTKNTAVKIHCKINQNLHFLKYLCENYWAEYDI